MNNININLPSYINFEDYRYIECDGKYYIIINNIKLPNNIENFNVIRMIKNIADCNIMIRQNNLSKDLTSYIAGYTSEIKAVNYSQKDIEILKKNKSDIEEIRRKIQIDNESLYSLCINIMLSDYNLEKLFQKVNFIEAKLSANGVIFKRVNFEQDTAFKNCLPFQFLDTKSKINLLNTGIIYLTPLFSENLIDKNGIYMGLNTSKKPVIINIFDKKYINSNVCILGSSGSGKSYFLKLNILRNMIIGRKQIIVDLDGEYTKVFNNSKSVVIDLSKKDKFNIFLQETKIVRKQDFSRRLSMVINILEYYVNNHCEKKLKKVKYQHLIDNFYKYIANYDEENYILNETITLKKVLGKETPPELEIFNGETSEKYRMFNAKNNILIFDLSNVADDHKKLYTYITFLIIKEIIMSNNNEKIIYFDEVWRIIDLDRDNFTKIISDFYKTIRKHKASIYTITQDIEDFLSYESSNYGKKILNNSNFKVLFNMCQYEESIVLKKMKNNSFNIESLNKGYCLLMCDSKVIKLYIDSCEYEKKIIEGSDYN